MSTTTTERGHGIGASYADRLSSDGYAIVIADLDEAGRRPRLRPSSPAAAAPSR